MMTICGIIFRVCVRDPKGRTRSLMAPVFIQARSLGVCAGTQSSELGPQVGDRFSSTTAPLPLASSPSTSGSGRRRRALAGWLPARARRALFSPRSQTIPALGTDSPLSSSRAGTFAERQVARRRDNYLLNYPLSFSGNVCSSVSREGGGGCLAKSAALDRTRCVKCSVLAGTPAHVHGRRQLTAFGDRRVPHPSFWRPSPCAGQKPEAWTTRAERVVGRGPQRKGSTRIRNSSAARRDNPECRLA